MANETIICGNCKSEVINHFCGNCGQKKIEGRLNWSEVRQEFTDKVIGLEKGFFHTFWEMLKRPGVPAKEYVNGIRKQYSSPVQFYLVGLTLMLLVFNYFHIMDSVVQNSIPTTSDINFSEYLKRFSTVFSSLFQNMRLITSLAIPIQALAFYWLFKKSKFSYLEILIFMLFINGMVAFLSASSILGVFWNVEWSVGITTTLTLLYSLIAVRNFFKVSWLKAIFSFIASYIIYSIIISIIMTLYTFLILKLEDIGWVTQ